MAASIAFVNLSDNLAQVDRLLEIHSDLTGVAKGRRFGVEILNKSAIVLLTACWEAFVEDLADEGFKALLAAAKSPTDIPGKTRTLASQRLREAKDERRVWDLAADGWRTVLLDYKTMLVTDLNTPKTKNVNSLFSNLFDIKTMSDCWYWQKMSRETACTRLDGYVTLRGGIAHRVSTASSVNKKSVEDYRQFAWQLATKSTNELRSRINTLVQIEPWDELPFPPRAV